MQRSLHAVAIGSPGGHASWQNVLPQGPQADVTTHHERSSLAVSSSGVMTADVVSMLDKLQLLQQEGAQLATRM